MQLQVDVPLVETDVSKERGCVEAVLSVWKGGVIVYRKIASIVLLCPRFMLDAGLAESGGMKSDG